MNIASGRVLDRLPAEEPCLAALFTSYSFDPSFFEEHVLRAVLRLTSDPVEQAERYHHEALRALQETPVVAIVDAGERRPGRRLPFDLLEVSDVVFHPKSVLLVYPTHARLMIGSGNLTFSGYGGNTELFFCRDLAYDNEAEGALLAAFDEHLARVQHLVRRRGKQLDLFREELRRRMQFSPRNTTTGNFALIDSTKGPILEQFADLLPKTATIKSIGMLAPFYERDDADELDVTSVFGKLASYEVKNAILDIGIAWDNPQVMASGRSELNDGLGRIWTWLHYNEAGDAYLEHLVPKSIGPNTLNYEDDMGQGRRCSLDKVQEAIEQGTLWMQPPPAAYAPRNTVSAVSKHFSEVRMWLHPATRMIGGRPIHRPLHAKLLVIGFRSGHKDGTLVLMGSPNMSRRALLMGAGKGLGNVELAAAFRLDSIYSLRDFVSELIHAPKNTFVPKEREFPELGRNYALAIGEASHDPRQRNLLVTWSDEATDMPSWRLTYDSRELSSSGSAPTGQLKIEDFDLNPSTAEVVLHVAGSEFPVPILVTDLVALPAIPAGQQLGLNELLLLLGRRIGAERAVQIAQKRSSSPGDAEELDSYFGEGFGPTDVFRAWWNAAEDLSEPSLSVHAFRLRLEGALGVGAAWSCMLESVTQKAIQGEEVWFYGAELLRTLADIELIPAADSDAKRKVLTAFFDRVRGDLGTIKLDSGAQPWVKRILAFYSEATE